MNSDKSRVYRLNGSISIMALAAALAATTATAQTAERAGNAGANDNAVAEVIVTAQRKSENLQDVPLAITAITGATLAQKNITDVTRLQDIAPPVGRPLGLRRATQHSRHQH